MTRKGEEHGELKQPPWKREESYRVGEMRMGRPDLPHIEAEIEGLMRLIGTLPSRIPWRPGSTNAYQVAYEVRCLLEPRIGTVTLGNGDAYADYYLWGPGDSIGRCATLCLPHPDDTEWAVIADRGLLFDGEMARNRLSHSVKRSAHAAIRELNRHWIHSPELSASG